MFANAQLLPISALQHLLFCERQCALIHVEQLWAENRLTVEGQSLHRKAHDPRKASGDVRGSTRQVRSLEIASHRLGLVGVADVFEFTGAGPPKPIEYKRGRPKKHDADRVQLCAQALCLEEMLGLDTPLAGGAIFYGQTRRRLDVVFDEALRDTTERAAHRLHEIIDTGITPTARREKKCDRCSLLNLCLPGALRPRRTASAYLSQTSRAMLAAP
ncbi:MAG: CRISPR-associated protein Cas4 [Phycisphaeraceae bacterium]